MFETEKFSLIANNLFLDFVNTLKMRNGEPFETLETCSDFVAWTVAAKLVEINEAKELMEKWGEEISTNKSLRETVKFRNLLREMAENIVEEKKISQLTIKAINEKLKKTNGYTEIVRNENGFEKRFRFDLSEPGKLLQPMAESAADFLCYGNFELLRKCEGSACVLYFYDTTKNHRRRWCSMNSCGNKAKAAAFYQRKKQTGLG
jgi:predicted RNA-binding Zn ribbon-like protein